MLRITSLCRPGVLLTSQSAGDPDIPIGGTKLGGWPDLPAPAQWPTLGNGSPMPFIAQVCLADVAPYDVEGVLPHGGMLSFFYDVIEQPWGVDPRHQTAGTVLSPARLLPAADLIPPLDAREPVVHPEPDASPMPARIERHQLRRTDAYQGPRYGQLAPGAADWRLLLQIDSDDDAGIMWDTTGRVYVWIREQDLHRTVDLLLTMNRRRVPDPQVDPLDQAKHELRQALASYGPAPASAVCHSICHSIWSCSPRPAIRLLTRLDCLPRSQLVREQPRQANPPNADGT